MDTVESTSRLEMQQVEGGNPLTCCTFILHDEDHTLGNALRYIIMKNPDVEFCGYSIPHPAENKINFRIQTRGVSAKQVFRKGLEDLMEVSQHVLQTFEESVKKHMETKNEENPSDVDLFAP